MMTSNPSSKLTDPAPRISRRPTQSPGPVYRSGRLRPARLFGARPRSVMYSSTGFPSTNIVKSASSTYTAKSCEASGEGMRFHFHGLLLPFSPTLARASAISFTTPIWSAAGFFDSPGSFTRSYNWCFLPSAPALPSMSFHGPDCAAKVSDSCRPAAR